MKVAVVGAGVAGLCCATELLPIADQLSLYERADRLGARACSWFAGGMLAPWCERENADEAVLLHGKMAMQWWREHSDGVVSNGSLVVAQRRDRTDLKRFAQRTSGFQWQDAAAIAALEPDLGERFSQGLYFPDEGHLNPRLAIEQLAERLQRNGASLQLGQDVNPAEIDADVVIDCRGYAARDVWPELRAVKGEMLILHSDEIQLQRPVRLLHPRIPLYVVPRSDGHFMVGATMLEASDGKRITARSMLELLSSAYALNPAFAEASIVEVGVDLRPAFNHNLPRLRREGKILRANGLYRHGFLLGPGLAQAVKRAVLNPLSTIEEF